MAPLTWMQFNVLVVPPIVFGHHMCLSLCLLTPRRFCSPPAQLHLLGGTKVKLCCLVSARWTSACRVWITLPVQKQPRARRNVLPWMRMVLRRPALPSAGKSFSHRYRPRLVPWAKSGLVVFQGRVKGKSVAAVVAASSITTRHGDGPCLHPNAT